MIKIFQNRRLEILQDVPQIDAFRTPEHVEVSEFTEVKVTLKTYCALQTQKHVIFQRPRPRSSHLSISGNAPSFSLFYARRLEHDFVIGSERAREIAKNCCGKVDRHDIAPDAAQIKC